MSSAQTIGKCYYCGNNPVSHTFVRLDEYFTLVNTPLRWLGESSLGRLIGKGVVYLASKLFRLCIWLRIVRYNTDQKRVLSDRSKVIWQEAARRGILMRQLIVFGFATEFFEATIRGKRFLFQSIPIPEHLQTRSAEWMDDKLTLKKRLMESGVPVARGGAFSRFGPMRDLFLQLDKPVIVKPAVGSRGRHTTTFIYTEQQLEEAFTIGRQISRRLVMEEHLIGSVYRATIVSGKVVGVLRGDPPRIIGDGNHSIAELVEIKNQNRHPRVKEVRITPQLEQFLFRNAYTLATVLPKAKTIDLSEKIGVGYGGYSAEEFKKCHPETKRILEEAGRVVNYPIIGFDFIIQNIAASPDTQKWGILEANSLPFIDLHHFPLEGDPINVAHHVWDLWQ